MKFIIISFLWSICLLCISHESFSQDYPSATLANDSIAIQVYLPDEENGYYRGTRFDWSGLISSIKYKDHEYFGYLKAKHDPFVHDAVVGPAEGYIKPGLGYEEAEPGETLIRIGVGSIQKEDEKQYNPYETYKIQEHGVWKVKAKKDCIRFTHTISNEQDYGYVYKKIIKLTNKGYEIIHQSKNTDEKLIETDQFNHNFCMLDNQTSDPDFEVSFPFAIQPLNDYRDFLININDKKINFLQEIENVNA